MRNYLDQGANSSPDAPLSGGLTLRRISLTDQRISLTDQYTPITGLTQLSRRAAHSSTPGQSPVRCGSAAEGSIGAQRLHRCPIKYGHLWVRRACMREDDLQSMAGMGEPR